MRGACKTLDGLPAGRAGGVTNRLTVSQCYECQRPHRISIPQACSTACCSSRAAPLPAPPFRALSHHRSKSLLPCPCVQHAPHPAQGGGWQERNHHRKAGGQQPAGQREGAITISVHACICPMIHCCRPALKTGNDHPLCRTALPRRWWTMLKQRASSCPARWAVLTLHVLV